jgi:acyl-CoA synthetase (AMP-forming)/AMP-acid ligase II
VLASCAAADSVRPGTVGLALPGVSLRLLDPAGQPVATGAVGEIHARGPNVFEGYHGRPAETAEVLRDGWFATGDLGSLDADGHLTIAGRLKDMIIVSGFNVYPREVEDALTAHPAVAEAAVVGLPDERTGERVRAVVVPVPGARLDSEELLDHARERLARYKLPREIHVAEALPRLPTGKVVRSALRGPPGEISPAGPPPAEP